MPVVCSRTRMLFGLLGLTILTVASQADAQITRHRDGWLFQFRMKPGQKARFDMRIVTEGMPTGRRTSRTVFRLDCRKVEKDVATVHFGLERDDDEVYDTGKHFLTLMIDRRGKAMWGKEPMTRLGVVFPVKPLKEGDTFPGYGIVSAGSAGQGTATDTYRFVGFSEFDGKRVAKLEVTSTATIPQGKASGSGVMLLDPQDGIMVHMKYSHAAEVTVEGKPVTIRQQVSVRRL